MSDSCFLNNSPLEQIHEIITWARENVNELITDMSLTEIVTSVKEGIGTPLKGIALPIGLGSMFGAIPEVSGRSRALWV